MFFKSMLLTAFVSVPFVAHVGSSALSTTQGNWSNAVDVVAGKVDAYSPSNDPVFVGTSTDGDRYLVKFVRPEKNGVTVSLVAVNGNPRNPVWTGALTVPFESCREVATMF